MDIVNFNPWWETGGIDKEISSFKRRYLFEKLRENLNKRYIDVIVGLRRVGKTVLMHHLIDHLLEHVNPKEIFYFSFDLEREDLDKIIKEYEEKILKDRIRDKKVYLFFDEIHKLKDWANKIKVLYDLNPGVKIVLSGSASLNLMRQSSESLTGRAKFHHMPPLTFREFIEFNNEKIPEDFEIHKRRLAILLSRFILRGFPETVNMSDKEAKEYIRELVVERIIYRDIPESFGVEDVEIVRILAEYIFKSPGIILNIDSLSRDLGRHKKTIRNALNYLELSFLIKRISNLRGSFLVESRKNKKAYPFHPSLSSTKDEDRVLETLIRSETNAGHYWRKQRNEVDFVLRNDKIIAVEVKNKEKIGKEDLKGLIKFLSVFNVDTGYIVSREEERIIVNNKKIVVMPVSKFILCGIEKLKLK